MDERRPLLIRNQSQNGRIPTRSRCQTQLACGAVLITEIFERIAFYGIVGNLVLFLSANPLGWNSYNAANASMVFTGLSYMTSIFGGWLADSTLGRFKTICIFFIVYIAGYTLMPVLAVPHLKAESHPQPLAWCAGSSLNNSGSGLSFRTHMGRLGQYSQVGSREHRTWTEYISKVSNPTNPSQETCSWAVYLTLTIIGIGTGAVKANVAPFGADQVKHEGTHMMRVFFNWFYWCINIGALFALGVLAYIQQESNFFWGLVAPNICLVIALVVFALGGFVYIMRPAAGSILTNVVRILIESCSVRRQRRIASAVTRSMDLSDMAPPPSCLDNAKVRYGGSFHDAVVDDVKVMGKITCIFLSLIPYWVVYFQMESTYVMQGLHMRLDFGHSNSTNLAGPTPFKIPAAWLSLFDVIFLIVLIPVMDRVIYPRLDKAGFRLSLRCRILIGMVFAVFSVATAGALEMYRLSVYWENDKENVYLQNIGGSNYSAADVSILWQVPQYALIGISEVFASVAGLELAYTHAPRSMQGIIMGLFWFTQGVGSLVGTATIAWFQNVFFFHMKQEDINCRIPCLKPVPTAPVRPTSTIQALVSKAGGEGVTICHACHLDYYFFTLAGLQLLGIGIFLLVALKFDIGGVCHPHYRHRLRIAASASSNDSSPLPSPPTPTSSSAAGNVSPTVSEAADRMAAFAAQRDLHVQQRLTANASSADESSGPSLHH